MNRQLRQMNRQTGFVPEQSSMLPALRARDFTAHGLYAGF
jgi:hypothetical protein